MYTGDVAGTFGHTPTPICREDAEKMLARMKSASVQGFTRLSTTQYTALKGPLDALHTGNLESIDSLINWERDTIRVYIYIDIVYIYMYTCIYLIEPAHSAGPSHLYDLSGMLGGDLFRAFAWNGSPPNIHIGWSVGWGSVPRICVERIPSQHSHRVSEGSREGPCPGGGLFTLVRL